MKFVLMFVLLSGSYLYGMEEEKMAKLPSKNQSHNNNYYSQVMAGVEQKYLGKKLPENATPLQIIGWLKTLHDGNWYKVDINIAGSKL